ncbi:RYamide receptor-like [Ostrea edulis]|uniref:RYamide receptor-like n=1 Tax=Ostrea edulis TaxID=37623 RepID=UPI00209615AD|nr:RYamide receptor-like [Ostrea edulis]
MNGSTNGTLESAPKISTFLQTMFIVMYSFIIVIAVGGNGIVCYLVYAYKRMRTVPNYFIVNLALSDIIMAIFCIPFTFVANLMLNYWPFGELMCPVVCYLQIVSVFLSAYTLMAMSVDRYIVIVHPFRKRITTEYTLFIIIIIWILSLSIPIPTLFNARIEYYSNTSGQCLETWEGNEEGRYAYSVGIMVLHYFAPMLVMMFCYTTIRYHIWLKHNQKDDQNKRRLQLASAKQKMIRMMVTVVIFYALCWLPFHVITLAGEQNPEIYNQSFMPVLWVFFHWLSMSNSCYNPIIYIWMSPKFRAGLHLAFHTCCRRKHSKCESDEQIDELGRNNGVVLRVEMQSMQNVNKKSKECRYLSHKEQLLSENYDIHGKIHSDT